MDGAAVSAHSRQHSRGDPRTDRFSRRLKASGLRATPSAHLPSQPKTLRRINLQKRLDLTRVPKGVGWETASRERVSQIVLERIWVLTSDICCFCIELSCDYLCAASSLIPAQLRRWCSISLSSMSCGLPSNSAYRHGTTIRVSIVEVTRPPMTTIASGR